MGLSHEPIAIVLAAERRRHRKVPRIVARSGLFVAATHPTTDWVLFGSREALTQGTGSRVRCVLTPEGRRGPFLLDPKSDITSRQPGVPLNLAPQVVRRRLRDAGQRVRPRVAGRRVGTLFRR
jgi:hypothetical protein